MTTTQPDGPDGESLGTPSNVLPIYRLRVQLKLVGKGRNYDTWRRLIDVAKQARIVELLHFHSDATPGTHNRFLAPEPAGEGGAQSGPAAPRRDDWRWRAAASC